MEHDAGESSMALDEKADEEVAEAEGALCLSSASPFRKSDEPWASYSVT